MTHADLHTHLVAQVTAWDRPAAQPGRRALLGILELHRPNTVNFIEPCERHRYKRGMSAADFSPHWHKDCPDCTSTPVVECSVTDCSWRERPCRELALIADALGVAP